MSVEELKSEIKDGGIVAVSTAVGVRVTREEMVAVAMSRREPAVIERALGREAAGVLPEAIRLVELRARVPRYQKEMLRYLARQEGTSIGTVLSRELEGMAGDQLTNLFHDLGLSTLLSKVLGRLTAKFGAGVANSFLLRRLGTYACRMLRPVTRD